MPLADFVVLVAAGSVLAALALLFHALHRRIGILALVGLLTLLSVAIASWGFARSPDVPQEVRASAASITLLPPLLVGVVALYLTHGAATARAASLLPLGAGAIVAAGAAFELPVPVLPPRETLLTTAAGALFIGALVSLACLAATAGFAVLARAAKGTAPGVAGLAGVLTGLVVYAVVVSASIAAGGPQLPGTPLGVAAGPIVAAVPAMLLAAFSFNLLMRSFDPIVLGELLDRPLLGAVSLVEEAQQMKRAIDINRLNVSETESAYRTLLESTREGVYVARTDGQIVYANSALSRLLDEPDMDLKGRNAKYLFNVQALPAGRFDGAVRPGRHRVSVDLPLSGRRSFEVFVGGGADAAAGEHLVRGQVTDITERVLRAEVEERKERAEFYLHLLRHDIGNYVAPPIANIELVLMEEGLDAETREFLTASQHQLEKVRELLKQVDALSNLDKVQPEPTDIVEVARSAGELFLKAHAEDIEISFDLPHDAVLVRGVPILDQVFINLLGNALRHATPPVHVTLRVKRAGEWVVASVEDEGPGVPDDVKAQLFQYGKKGASSRGKGLGLYIVRTIVRSLGGEAVVEDRVAGRPEKGAAFRVKLPAM